MKKIVVLLLASTLLLSMFGCGCIHDFTDADCTTPKTCRVCEATEGNSLFDICIDDIKGDNRFLFSECETFEEICKECFEDDFVFKELVVEEYGTVY